MISIILIYRQSSYFKIYFSIILQTLCHGLSPLHTMSSDQGSQNVRWISLGHGLRSAIFLMARGHIYKLALTNEWGEPPSSDR